VTLLAAAREGWQALRQSLEAPPRATELARLDRQADTVVAQANALVLALESSGAATTVQAINVAGALRWRSQRMAKLALMQGTGGDKAALTAAMEQTAAEFEEGLAALQQAPLSTPLIRSMLEHGESAWKELRAAVPGADRAAGRMKLAAASEGVVRAVRPAHGGVPAQHPGADGGLKAGSLSICGETGRRRPMATTAKLRLSRWVDLRPATGNRQPLGAVFGERRAARAGPARGCPSQRLSPRRG
jgi:hypothetical protein